MSKYKLVPVEPTEDMRKAFHSSYGLYEAGYGECPDSQWRSMLAAAPVVEQAQDEINSLRAEMENFRLLLDALTPQILDWVRCGLATNGRLKDGDHPALANLRDAIAACKGGAQ